MKNRIWQIAFTMLISKTPERWGGMREYCVRKYIKKAGRNISIGRFSRIHKNTIIGDNSGVGRCCEINNGVSIGENVMMGPEVVFYTQNHKTDETNIPMREQGMTEIMPIVVEDDVWIGARVVVLPGCTIGKGSVIGACSVVSKSIPPYSVAVGSPARVVKYRK